MKQGLVGIRNKETGSGGVVGWERKRMGVVKGKYFRLYKVRGEKRNEILETQVTTSGERLGI